MEWEVNEENQNKPVFRCIKIFEDLEKLLTPRKYEEARDFLLKLNDERRSISELKSALVITYGLKDHPVLKDAREIIHALYDKKMGKVSKEE